MASEQRPGLGALLQAEGAALRSGFLTPQDKPSPSPGATGMLQSVVRTGRNTWTATSLQRFFSLLELAHWLPCNVFWIRFTRCCKEELPFMGYKVGWVLTCVSTLTRSMHSPSADPCRQCSVQHPVGSDSSSTDSRSGFQCANCPESRNAYEVLQLKQI